MSDEPQPGWSGFFAGLPAEPAREPPALAPAPEPPPQAEPERTMPNVHQGARTPLPADEGAHLAAVMRQTFPGFR